MGTDPFIFEVIGEHCDDKMLENKEYFDLSNFSKSRKYYTDENKKYQEKSKMSLVKPLF